MNKKTTIAIMDVILAFTILNMFIIMASTGEFLILTVMFFIIMYTLRSYIRSRRIFGRS